jgi:hypothetical protein
MPADTLPARRRPRTDRRPDPLDGLLGDADRAALDPAALDWLRRLLGGESTTEHAERQNRPEK